MRQRKPRRGKNLVARMTTLGAFLGHSKQINDANIHGYHNHHIEQLLHKTSVVKDGFKSSVVVHQWLQL